MPFKDKQKRYEAIRKSVAKKPEHYKALNLNNKRKASQKGYHILRRYGLTKEDFDRMLKEQGGGCAICGNPPTMKTRQSSVLHVDHCHRTGKVRGLLCVRCNHLVGYIEHDLRSKAEAYLAENS